MRDLKRLREELVRNLTLDFFEEEEISSILRDIASLAPRLRQKSLALCLALSHASSSLVANTLRRIERVSLILSPSEAECWLTQAFDLLDSQGIDAFMSFASRTDEASLQDFRAPGGLRLRDVSATLETYLKAISGLDLKIAAHDIPYTDTATVFLPPHMEIFREPGKNLFIYKLMTAHLWTQIAEGSLTNLTFSFDDPETAMELYTILEAIRNETFLRKELPRLMDEAEWMKEDLFQERPELQALPEKTAFVEALYQYYLMGRAKGLIPEQWREIFQRALSLRDTSGPASSLSLLMEAYGIVQELEGEHRGIHPSPFFGVIRPDKVSRRIQAGKAARRKKLDGVITKLVSLPEFEPRRLGPGEPRENEQLLDPQKEYLLIRGRLIELDSEMREYLEEKKGIPGGILVKGSDFGTGSPITLSDLLEEEEVVETKGGGIRYDEWDYKRGGYKKQWCSLYEHLLHPGHEPFVELTLRRYGGYVSSLRKRFELLRREPRTLRRQKEGDDIDIDGVVEAFADMRAGLAPGENLFTRMDRQERNVAVLFLLDMSGSTKGWVNEAEKESLVLMCEALDNLGDRYAICGFSGMTRTRCDFYTIKRFDESYGDAVKGRISGVIPKDYTRMGPPIRHSTGILAAVEARTKILITLSDGKPEDWDAYKGDYAIEDTRRALVEAREKGIHPFCITIDKEAGSYLPHMFGESHYIVIDDVRKLPSKITEIYRRLTQ